MVRRVLTDQPARPAPKVRRVSPDHPVHQARPVQTGPRVLPDHLEWRVRRVDKGLREVPAHLARWAPREYRGTPEQLAQQDQLDRAARKARLEMWE
jgi:hypothetical protein